MTQDKDLQDSPLKGPSKGIPDEQTPAINHPGEYSGDSPEQKDKNSQASNQGNAGDESDSNQGTESR